jgi:hypothetical protein
VPGPRASPPTPACRKASVSSFSAAARGPAVDFDAPRSSPCRRGDERIGCRRVRRRTLLSTTPNSSGRGVCMRRAIGISVVLIVVGGLWMAYRDVRQLVARPATRPSETGDGLTDPPNWKVELPAARPTAPTALPTAPAAPRAQERTAAGNRLGRVPGTQFTTATRYGAPDSSSAPFWIRRSGKLPVAEPIDQRQVRSVEPPSARVSPEEPAEIPPPPPAPVVPASSLVAVQSPPHALPETVVDDEHRALLNHAKFLIRAGLAPIAKDPLQQIIREVPGTPLAREARVTLDTIQN